MEVCIVGDDARPPWNNASSILAKRLTECLSPRIKCYLASLDNKAESARVEPGIERISMGKVTGGQAADAVRLAVGVRQTSADIVHVVGTNAMVFSPILRLTDGRKRILRHIFTSYDASDRMIRPVRRFLGRLFISGYAFTTPWIGEWNNDLLGRTGKFLIRPPINCDFYRPVGRRGSLIRGGPWSHTILYMGPLFPSRFPAGSVLAALKRLNRNGLDPRLVVLTSAQRSSAEQAQRVTAIANDLGVGDRVQVRRVDLTEAERVEAYSAVDLVIFPFFGPVPEKLADPPFGLLEAMACGSIVLGTSVLSIPEVVEDGQTGFLARDTSVVEICETLSRALTSRSREGMAERARQRILGEFSYPVIGRRAVEVFQTLLQDN